MWNSGFSCTPTSALDGAHFAISHIQRPHIFPSDQHRADFCMSQSCKCNDVHTSTDTCVYSRLLDMEWIRCCHNSLLCTHITWKCECFNILKMSLFLVLPVPTRKMWNSTISCTPTSTLVGVQIFICDDRKDIVRTLTSWEGRNTVQTPEKYIFHRTSFIFSRQCTTPIGS